MKSHRRDAPSRRGYTLIEMVIVIAAAMLVMGLAASLLGALFKIERGSRAAVTDAATVSRLARQFRADVHAAESVKAVAPKASGIGFELTGTEGPSITYRVDGGRLIREASRKGEVRAREAFAIERLGPIAFRVEGESALLILPRRVEEGTAVFRPAIRIVAAVGKHRSLADAALKPKGDR